MKEYHKIQTFFKRDPKTKMKTLISSDNYCLWVRGAAAKADTQFTVFDLSALKNNVLSIISTL